MSELDSDAGRRYVSKVDCEGGPAGGVPTAGEIRADGMADGRLDAWGLTSWALAKTSVSSSLSSSEHSDGVEPSLLPSLLPSTLSWLGLGLGLGSGSGLGIGPGLGLG